MKKIISIQTQYHNFRIDLIKSYEERKISLAAASELLIKSILEECAQHAKKNN